MLLVSLVAGPLGLGAISPAEADTCAAECDGCEDEAPASAEVRERGSRPCPPLCDHCSGCDQCSCSSLGAIGAPPSMTMVMITGLEITRPEFLSARAPTGERDGVFRPPRV
jgi:hypothetical protein